MVPAPFVKNKMQTRSTKQSPTKPQTTWTLYFDGGSRGNPGIAGSGSFIIDAEGNEVWADAYFIGRNNTNNEAEYTGLLRGLQHMAKIVKPGHTLTVRGDSELVIKQMRGEYKVSSAKLRPLWQECCRIAGTLPHVVFEHVPRAANAKADALSNIGMDKSADVPKNDKAEP